MSSEMCFGVSSQGVFSEQVYVRICVCASAPFYMLVRRRMGTRIESHGIINIWGVGYACVYTFSVNKGPPRVNYDRRHIVPGETVFLCSWPFAVCGCPGAANHPNHIAFSSAENESVYVYVWSKRARAGHSIYKERITFRGCFDSIWNKIRKRCEGERA